MVAYQAEGPVWSPRWGGQLWVDMLAGDVLSLGCGHWSGAGAWAKSQPRCASAAAAR